MADGNTLMDLNGFDANATQGFQLPTLPDLNFLGGLPAIAEDFILNVASNISAVELGVIFSLVFFLLLLLRAKVLVHLLLWVAAGVVVFIIAAIIFGVINL